jgi:hypothetical protein
VSPDLRLRRFPWLLLMRSVSHQVASPPDRALR